MQHRPTDVTAAVRVGTPTPPAVCHQGDTCTCRDWCAAMLSWCWQDAARVCLSHLPAPQGLLASVVPRAEAPPASPCCAKTTNNLAAPKQAEPHEPLSIPAEDHPPDPEEDLRRADSCFLVPAAALQVWLALGFASSGNDPTATEELPAQPSLAPWHPEAFGKSAQWPDSLPLPDASARRRCGQSASSSGRGTDCPQKSVSVPKQQLGAGSPVGLYPVCLSLLGAFGEQGSSRVQ